MYAVLFDIDGTLIQTGGAGQLAFAETFAAEFGAEPLSPEVSFAGRSDRAIAMDLMRAHNVEPSDANWRLFRSAYVSRLPETLKRCEGSILPGVAELVAVLRDRGDVAVGLLTGNVERGAEAKLSYYGLYDQFAFGGFGDDVTDRNDIARAAQAAAKDYIAARDATNDSAGLSGVMVVGDTVYDVRCAHSIDAFAVATPTGGTDSATLQQESPHLLVETLEEADAIIAVIDKATRSSTT